MSKGRCQLSLSGTELVFGDCLGDGSAIGRHWPPLGGVCHVEPEPLCKLARGAFITVRLKYGMMYGIQYTAVYICMNVCIYVWRLYVSGNQSSRIYIPVHTGITGTVCTVIQYCPLSTVPVPAQLVCTTESREATSVCRMKERVKRGPMRGEESVKEANQMG